MRIRYETKVRVNVPSSGTAAEVGSRVSCVCECIAFFASHVFYLLFEMFSLDSGVCNFLCTRAPSFVCRAKHIYSFIFLRADEIVKVSYFFFAAIRVFAFLLSK